MDNFNGHEIEIIDGIIESNPYLPCSDGLWDRWFSSQRPFITTAPSATEMRLCMTRARSKNIEEEDLNYFDYEE